MNLAYLDDLNEITDPDAISLIIMLIKTYTIIEYDYESTGYNKLDWDTLIDVTQTSEG